MIMGVLSTQQLRVSPLPGELRGGGLTARATQGFVVSASPQDPDLRKPVGTGVGRENGAQESGQSQGPAPGRRLHQLPVAKDAEGCCWAGTRSPTCGRLGPSPRVPRVWLLRGE